MAGVDGMIGTLLGRAKARRGPPGQRARPVGDHPSASAITLTVVARSEAGAWTYGEEIEALCEIVARKLPGRDLGPFHRLEIVLSPETTTRLGPWGEPGRLPSLVMAEMPLETGRVYTAPFQSAGTQVDGRPDAQHGADERRLLDPIGHFGAGGDLGRDLGDALSEDRRARLDALIEHAAGAVDSFPREEDGLRAAIASDVVEASLWPPGFEHERPIASLYEEAVPTRRQRFAIVLAERSELAHVHETIVETLAPRIEVHGKALENETADDAATRAAFLKRQAAIAAWQALAGADNARNFGSGSQVATVAESYLDSAVLRRLDADALRLDPIAAADDQDARAEILRLLAVLKSPRDEASLLEAIKDAIENGHVFLPRAKLEALLGRVIERRNAL
ncbi:hypothetical protein [Fulvimarina sp. MAC3]|uniref:hypothetical protein n=1 Tax=Fulvimarina sp. MAC3 TaxID=3148887 RepID=UPI0031FC5BFA